MEPKAVLKARCDVFQTVDTAMKAGTTNDWTVVLTFAWTPDHEGLVLDVTRRRMEIPEQLSWVLAQKVRMNARWQGVEDKSSGTGLIQEAMRRGSPFRILTADGDKVSRSDSTAILMENGGLYFRRDAAWLAAFEAELLAFPAGKHDDQVDCLSYAARSVRCPDPVIIVL